MQDLSKFCCLVYEDASKRGIYRRRLVNKSDVMMWVQYLLYECDRERVKVVKLNKKGHELPIPVIYEKANETNNQ